MTDDVLHSLLRKTVAGQPVFPTPIELRAADEITRLRSENERLWRVLIELSGSECRGEVCKEITRAALQERKP